MIQQLCDVHAGATIAIVGSGPTASTYRFATNDYDVTIGVNGAALLRSHFNYFLCGDHNAYKRDWFNIECSNIRIIANLVATMDERLYPMNLFPDLTRQAVPFHKYRQLGELPKPVAPHMLFRYRPFNVNRLNKKSKFLLYKGTISCCALQLAWIMGAYSVDIYGCPFHHNKGNYFYITDKVGRINASQLEVMQTVISTLRSKGLIINIIGDSKLK